jgi:signal transduction histidine kinase
MYDIQIPLVVIFGDINDYPVTVVDNGHHLFYLVIDYISPSEWNNIVFALPTALIFILGLYFFIRHYLKPVELMKDRIEKLEQGDMQSSINIIGEDELAELSHSINKMIKEINSLLENKHQLLLEVSHELRSPLARMQFLIEMLPQHKNNTKLRQEVNYLEGMIDNLLLSDRLSMPYSTLELSEIKTSKIIAKIFDLFPSMKEKIKILNSIPNEKILIDETKFIIAIRNLLDNALKYGSNKDIEFCIEKTDKIEFHIKDLGIGISDENIDGIIEPFYQANKTVTTTGFGLGLTICKKIIESHQGELKIQSKEGEGSVFSLFLSPIKD